MKLFGTYILFVLSFGATAFAGAGNDSTDGQFSHSPASESPLLSGKKSTALFYSVIIPGSGQTMLGSPYKGFGFTFAGFGSALTTLISHNNFVASNERLDALEYQYRNSITWESSSQIYRSLTETHKKMNNYKKMRNTFAVISTVVWTLNIVDLVFFTEEEGDQVFSMIRVEQKPVQLAGNRVDLQHQLVVTIPLQ